MPLVGDAGAPHAGRRFFLALGAGRAGSPPVRSPPLALAELPAPEPSVPARTTSRSYETMAVEPSCRAPAPRRDALAELRRSALLALVIAEKDVRSELRARSFAQAALLFPSREALLDTLRTSSPYRRPAAAAEGGF